MTKIKRKNANIIIVVVTCTIIVLLLTVFVPRNKFYVNYRLKKIEKMFQENRVSEAVPLLQNIVKKNPYCGPALQGLGFAYAMDNDWEQAAFYYQRAVDAGDTYCLYMLAGIYFKTDQLDKIDELVPALIVYRLTNYRNLICVLAYAIETKNQELFNEALNGVSPKYIYDRPDLAKTVAKGRRMFRRKPWEHQN